MMKKENERVLGVMIPVRLNESGENMFIIMEFVVSQGS